MADNQVSDRKRVPKASGASSREAILKLAIRYFGKHSYEGAHVRKMLMGAGINVSLAHYHFGSKRQLYHAVVEHFLDGVLADREARLLQWRTEVGPVEERLVSLFMSYSLPYLYTVSGKDGRDFSNIVLDQMFGGGQHGAPYVKATLDLRKFYQIELEALLPQHESSTLARAFAAFASMMLSDAADFAGSAARHGVPQRKEKSAERAMFISRLFAAGLMHLTENRKPPKPKSK